MSDHSSNLEVRAFSPGNFTILVVSLPSGELRTTYMETDYDLDRSKPVTEDWLRDNAIGRHSFVPVDPPEEIETSALAEYALNKRGG